MRSALCMVSVILILTNTQLSIIVVAIFIQHSWKFDVNITRIESRPVQSNSAKFDFFVDFYGRVGDTNVNALLQELKGMTDKLLVLDEKEVSYKCMAYIVFHDSLCLSCILISNLVQIDVHIGTLVPPTHFRTRSNSQPYP